MRKEDRESRLRDFFAALQADLSGDRSRSVPAAERLLARMRKRGRIGGQGLKEKALVSFLAVNESLRGFTHNLDAEIIDHAQSFIRHTLERYTRSLDGDYIQGTFKYSFLLDNWRFGPGASHEVQDSHAVDKIEARWTCTRNAEPLVRILRASNTYFQRFDALNGNDGVRHVRGSKLETVPKNEDNERTIAIEPLGNMALQLAVGRYLENSLAKIGLDITRQQPLNKALACRGSLDGSVCTIDLKSASDMISISLVRALMPSNWSVLLEQLRSTHILVKGVWHELHMISTMGNGFTFPLMTLVILSLVYANRARRGGSTNHFVDWSNTAVYGDDIIVPSDEYEDLCSVLHSAGLVVNRDKSFASGPFRESCGGDYWCGEDITPFYIQHLDDDAHVYAALNSVILWSSHHLLLPRSIEFLRGLLRKVQLVPEYANPESGLRTRDCPRRYSELKPKVVRTAHRPTRSGELFIIPLMAGGYLVPYRDQLTFTPRLRKVRWELRKSRLPRGYLDGRCGLSFTASESRDISFIVSMFF